MQCEGKVVIVTGGGRGIGRDLALGFAAEGASVVIAGRTVSALEETAASIEKHGQKVLSVPTDLADDAAVKRLFERTQETFGRLDVLINNAGIMGSFSPVTEISIEEWDEVNAINVRGIFLCCRAGVPMLKETRGSIINMSSLGGGLRAYPNRLPYAVSKSACVTIAKSLGIELAPHGVRVNAICPGPVTSERFERVIEGRAKIEKKSYQEVREWIIDQSPLHHVTAPEEIVACALWLSSDAAASVTAQHINLTCGVEVAP